MKTSEFSGGNSDIFPQDCYGNEALIDLCPFPSNVTQNDKIFEKSGKFLNKTFHFARDNNIRICVGTQSPVVKGNTSINSIDFYEG